MKTNFLAALPFLMVAAIALAPSRERGHQHGCESQVFASRDPGRPGWRRIGVSLAELE